MTTQTHALEGEHEALLPKWWRSVDTWSIALIMMLFFIGIVLSFAASPPLAEKRGLEPMYFVFKHSAFGAMSIAIMLAISMLSVQNARRLGCIVFLVAMVALAFLPVFGSDFNKGATRWYSLGFGSLQPSEFLKPGLVVVTAWLISGTKDDLGPEGYFFSLFLTLSAVVLLVMQPDFGQSALVLCSWAVVYFISGGSMLLLYVLAFLGLAAGYLAYMNVEHVSNRINEFIFVLSGKTDNKFTQLDLAANAIENGGLFGTGSGDGKVKWSLPDAHTDLIIAVAAEEYGLAMVILIVLLFMLLLWRSISRLAMSDSNFIILAGTGLIATFTLQALINLLVTVRLFPPKGMTLPLISQGGSSMLAIGLLLGILLALTRSNDAVDLSDLPISDSMERQDI